MPKRANLSINKSLSIVSKAQWNNGRMEDEDVFHWSENTPFVKKLFITSNNLFAATIQTSCKIRLESPSPATSPVLLHS